MPAIGIDPAEVAPDPYGRSTDLEPILPNGDRLPDIDAYYRHREWTVTRHDDYRRGRAWVCFACGTTERLELHHRTYERLGHEDLNDLVPLCKVHHMEVHDLVAAEGLDLKTATSKVRAAAHLAAYEAQQVRPQSARAIIDFAELMSVPEAPPRPVPVASHLDR